MLPGGGAGVERLDWNALEGNLPFMDQSIDAHTPPTFSSDHRSDQDAVIADRVYRGDALPDLDGTCVFGDRWRRTLISFDPETAVLPELEGDTLTSVEFGVGPGDRFCVIDFAQGIWRVEPA